MKHKLAILLFAFMALVFVACSDKADENTQSSQHIESTDSAQSADSIKTDSIESSTESTSVDSIAQQPRPIKAFGTNPPLTVLLEILNPNGLVALNYKPYEEDLPFMPERVRDLPVLGHMGDRSVSIESILTLEPDIVIFSNGTPDEILEPYIKAGVKALRVDAFDFEKLPEAIDALKTAFSADKEVVEKADKLLEFVAKSQQKLESLQDSITHRPKIYFAQGFDGLKSQCAKDGEKDLAYRIGGVNALSCSKLDKSVGQSQINYEILLDINPEVIFVREIPFYKELLQNPPAQWQNLQALQDKRVYYAPSTPSNWLMRPPSVMQSLGFLWAFAKVQPELLSEDDVKQEAQSFFATFLRELSDADYKRIQGLSE